MCERDFQRSLADLVEHHVPRAPIDQAGFQIEFSITVGVWDFLDQNDDSHRFSVSSMCFSSPLCVSHVVEGVVALNCIHFHA